ncbi:PTS system cellobiose-specific IIC component [Spiroplasma sabaudiense Ar-1343]|uniref:PTS system cellobiose-specific IIC component n=1 Tax=Spiroplasma sabaudiense Ar-1343 TaxID=1276257 RepID=W6ABC4_9MOLU|nr:PTS transporter subunit EIIC [Spiroplasma sabaudiense]AHI54291.1 PTS system cellobiose-specific IIC component [Spiroplasma sabaudiense Ar-1343]
MNIEKNDKEQELFGLETQIKDKKKELSQSWVNNNVMPGLTKFANQRHMLALRNAVVANIPLIIIGALFLIILNFPIGSGSTDLLSSLLPPKLVTTFQQINRMTMGLMSFVTAFAIGSELAKSYKMDPTTGGVLTFTAFAMWVGADMLYVGLNDAGGLAGGVWAMNMANIGSKGLFVAIISGIAMYEFYRLCKKYNITIRMPSVVPKSVSNSFIILIPILIWATVVGLTRFWLGFDFINDLGKILNPIQGALTGTLPGVMLTGLLITVFWMLGISGASVVGSFLRPFWTTAITENNDAFNAGLDIPYLYPEEFLQWGVWVGGSGATLGLLISALLLAKSKQIKSISKVSIVPGIFNINEPVIFGFPIMLNAFLFIPFILTPQICILVGALLMQVLNVRFVATAPWTLPGPIGAILSAGVDWKAVFIPLATIGISTVCYAPFMMAYDKSLLKQELFLEGKVYNKDEHYSFLGFLRLKMKWPNKYVSAEKIKIDETKLVFANKRAALKAEYLSKMLPTTTSEKLKNKENKLINKEILIDEKIALRNLELEECKALAGYRKNEEIWAAVKDQQYQKDIMKLQAQKNKFIMAESELINKNNLKSHKYKFKKDYAILKDEFKIAKTNLKKAWLENQKAFTLKFKKLEKKSPEFLDLKLEFTKQKLEYWTNRTDLTNDFNNKKLEASEMK